jgi:hypothetical protein
MIKYVLHIRYELVPNVQVGQDKITCICPKAVTASQSLVQSFVQIPSYGVSFKKIRL